MGKTEKRADEIIRMVTAKGRVSVVEVVDSLAVSEATVRRLFAALEKEGKVVRNYGGIQLPAAQDGYSFKRYEKVQENEKRQIGIRAAQLVQSGDSIYLDCGTTVARMAEALNVRIAAGELISLSIVTNSIVNMNLLSLIRGSRVIMLGGEYNHERRDFSGPITERCLEIFHFKQCFLGSDGVTSAMGYTTNHLGLSSLNRKVLSRSDSAIVLTDKSKFGRDALVSFAEVKDIHTIVTDSLPSAKLVDEFQRADTQFILAE
jgi:DeoR/GlpR family transcriptional regulator of sugar metabolism